MLNSDRIEQLIRESVERDAPLGTARPGPECPPLLSFEEGVATGWRGSPEWRRHVSGCLHCQRMTSAVWRDECPPEEVVRRYKRDASLCPDATAMRIHLEQHCCERCLAITAESSRAMKLTWAAIGMAASLFLSAFLIPWLYEPGPPLVSVGGFYSTSKGLLGGDGPERHIGLGRACAFDGQVQKIAYPEGTGPVLLALTVPPHAGVGIIVSVRAESREFTARQSGADGSLVFEIDPAQIRRHETYRVEIVEGGPARRPLCVTGFTLE